MRISNRKSGFQWIGIEGLDQFIDEKKEIVKDNSMNTDINLESHLDMKHNGIDDIDYQKQNMNVMT